jgi:uncharacterized small protein (DUF1192 family)
MGPLFGISSEPARWRLRVMAGERQGETIMVDLSSLSTAELADRIAILRANIRQLTEQAASQSGAADEDRNAERMAQYNDELDSLLKEQERRLRR